MPTGINLNELLDPLDPSTIKFNGSLLWMEPRQQFLCAFRAVKKPFWKITPDSPNFPYLWENQKFWYDNLNYIGLVLMDRDYTPDSSTFRKYFHMYQELDLVEFEGRGISFSGPEDPRLYFKKDGQPYMLYNAVIPREESRNCKVQCVGMYEIRIRPSFFENFDSQPLYVSKERKIVCKEVINDLAKSRPTKQSTIKNFAPSSELQGDVDYIVDSYNRYKIFYAEREGREQVTCSENWSQRPSNCSHLAVPQLLSDLFAEDIRGDISVALTTPEIRPVRSKQEVLGVAHVRVSWKYLLDRMDELQDEFRYFLELIEYRRATDGIPVIVDVYLMMMYVQDRCGKILRTSRPFIPILGDQKLEDIPLYSVVFPCGVTRCCGDDNAQDIIITYGYGDCLLNSSRFTPEELEERLHDEGNYDLSSFHLCRCSAKPGESYRDLLQSLEVFKDSVEESIAVAIPPGDERERVDVSSSG